MLLFQWLDRIGCLHLAARFVFKISYVEGEGFGVSIIASFSMPAPGLRYCPDHFVLLWLALRVTRKAFLPGKVWTKVNFQFWEELEGIFPDAVLQGLVPSLDTAPNNEPVVRLAVSAPQLALVLGC